MGTQRAAIFETITSETKDVLLSILKHNHLDISCMTEDAAWYVGSALQRIAAADIQEFLNSNSLNMPIEEPTLIFANAEEMGSECISVTGKYQYLYIDGDPTLVKVSFSADWILRDGNWKMKKLFTTSRKDYDNPNVWNDDIRIDKDVLYDTIPVGIIVCGNSDALIVQLMNSLAYGLLGFQSISEYKRNIGESAMTLVHPEDLPLFLQFVQKIRERGFAESEVFRVRKKDFSYLWVRFLGSLAEDKWLVLSCIDHSDHKGEIDALIKEHQKIQEEHDIYRMLVDYLPGGIHRCQLFDPVHLEYVSDSLCELCGYSRQEIKEDLHSRYIDLMVPDDQMIFVNAIKRLIEYPHTEQLEYRMLKKDGTIIWVSDFIRSVRHTDGKMWAYSVIQDIDELHSRRELFGDIAEEMPMGFATYRYRNGMLDLLYCNNAYAECSGYSKIEYVEIARKSPFALVFEEDVHLIDDLLNELRVVNDSARAEFDFRIRGKNRTFKVRFNCSVEKDGKDGFLVRVFQQELFDSTTTNEMLEETPEETNTPRVEVHTFGYFAVFVDGQPINFRSQKAREMLALLVDRRGGYANQSTIISFLWENESANKTTLARCRKTYKTLVDELKEYGIEDIVESDHGARRIVPEKIQCDLFNYLSGKPQYHHLFKGNYMLDYSWSEMTQSELERNM